jgi:hypothetical protein
LCLSKAKSSVLSHVSGLENVLFNDFIDNEIDSESCLTLGFSVDHCSAVGHVGETVWEVSDQRESPQLEHALQFGETCRPILNWHNHGHISHALSLHHSPVIGLVELHHCRVDLHCGLVWRPHEVCGLVLDDSHLDAVSRVCQQHVAERTIKDAVGADARCGCRARSFTNENVPLVFCPAGELVLEPIQGELLQLLEEVL